MRRATTSINRLAMTASAVYGLTGTLTASAADVLEEVVVTSTKRSVSVQDAPISVGVLTGEFINTFDIRDMGDIQNFVPGLQVQPTFGSWAVRIRGLGSGITNLAFDSSVPIYIDEVYCGRGKCMESTLLDVERLEVARGPQGALFGKSTIAGAISATSARPTDEFESLIKIGAELEYGGFASNAFLSGPLSDNLRARLAVRYDDLDGYTENTFTGDEDGGKQAQAIRLGVEFDLNDRTGFYLKLENGNSETNGRNNQPVRAGSFAGVSSDPAVEFVPDDIRHVSTGTEREDYYDYDWSSATLIMDSELFDHSIKAIASYWEYDSEWWLDVDGVPEELLNTLLQDEYESSSLEIRFLSPQGQTLEYIAGLWYQDSDLKTRQYSPFAPLFWQAVTGIPVAVGPTIPPLSQAFIHGSGMDRNFSRDSDAFSIYGQLTWNVSERFRAILDLRYTEEEQDAVGLAFPLLFSNGAFDPIRVSQSTAGHDAEYVFYQNRKDDSLDPSLRLQFDINEDAMVYAVYAEGSKAGGMKANDPDLGDQLLAKADDTGYLQQFAGVSAVTTDDLKNGLTLQSGNGIFDFEDEQAKSWELGYKTTLADGAATLNIALFTTEFTNLQTSNYNGTVFIIGNAGQATVDGAEIEFNWQATNNLRLASSLAWIDATYDDWADAQCVLDANDNPVNADCDVASGTENQAGEKLERSPDLELNLSAIWESQLTDSLLLKAAASVYYSGDYFVQPTQQPTLSQDSFTKWDLRVALAATDNRWEVGINGRNLGDEMTLSHAYSVAGNHFNNLTQGRSITLEGIYRFE